MTTKLRASLLAVAVIQLVGAASASVAQDKLVHAEDNTARRAGSITEPSGQDDYDSLPADKLFLEGRTLLRQGQPQEACRMLERSHRLAPTLATLLNLGLCHRASAHLATAHDYYRQAEVKATLDGDAKRRDFAHDEAAALSTLRASLTLRISGIPNAPIEVRIDDVVQPREVWERPMFIDAGEHRIAVRVGEKSTWEGFVQVIDGNKHVIVIPEFKPEGSLPAMRNELSAPVVTPPPAPVSSDRPEDDSAPNTARVVAVSVAGAGLAALGVSLVYTILASGTFEESDDAQHCSAETQVCDARGLQLREEAQTQAMYATVFGISGAVALAGGVALWFLSAREPREAPHGSLSFQAGPHAVAGSWTTTF
jgi:hypothetical protein